MDRKSVENSNDQALLDLENLDLTRHKLIFDGPLVLNLSKDHTVDMHVMLFEDILVLLQKQEDRFIPKCHNTNAHGDTFTHYSVVKLHNLLARMLAADKRSFFVAGVSESSTQLYELTAASTELSDKWCTLINNSVEEFKKSQTQKIGVDNNRAPRMSSKGRISNNVQEEHIIHPIKADLFEVTSQLQQKLEIVDESSSQVELILPGEANVITDSAAEISSLELLHHTGEQIKTALHERAHLLANFLHLSWDQYLAATSKLRSASRDQVMDDSLPTEVLLAKNIEMTDLCMKLIDISRVFIQQQVDKTNHSSSINIPACLPAQSDNASIADMPPLTTLEQITEFSSNLSSLLNQEMNILPKCEPPSSNRTSAMVEEKEEMYAPGTAKGHCDSVRESIEPFSMSPVTLGIVQLASL